MCPYLKKGHSTGKRESLQQMVLGKWYAHIREWNGNLILSHIQKLTQNGLKTQNVRPETAKILEENRVESFKTLALTMFSKIWHYKHRQHKEKEISKTTSN